MFSISAVLWALAFVVGLGRGAVAPTSQGLEQPAVSGTFSAQNISDTHNTTINENPFIFAVPSTPIKLHLSNYHGLLNQGELNLCIIEGIGTIFQKVVDKGSDGSLPLNAWSTKWANIIINIEDVSPPAQAMTYGYMVATLRGIALFSSLFGYVGMDVAVYHDKQGFVGTGHLGQIIPLQTS